MVRLIEKLQLGSMQAQVICIAIVSLVAINNALFAVALLAALLYFYRQRYAAEAKCFIEKHGLLLGVILPCVVLLSASAYKVPMASDDLLRNIIVGPFYQFNYHQLYPVSSLPSFSMWWGFDHALAGLQNWLTPLQVMWFTQAVICLSMMVVVASASFKMLGKHVGSAYVVGFVLSLALSLSWGRITLARPEIFLAVWSLAAILVTSRVGLFGWVLSGAVLATSYWLAFLYFVAVLLLQVNLKQKLLALAVLTIAHLAFWLLMFGHTYLDTLLWLKQVLDSEIIGASENNAFGIGNPFLVALICIASVGLVKTPSKQAWLIAFVIAFFAMSNQVRYLGVIAPLLCLLSVLCWKDRLTNLSHSTYVTLAICSCILMAWTASKTPTLDDSQKFKIPHSARVMTGFNEATFALPFFNPGIQVEPSYAIGAAPKEIQQFAIDLSKGEKIECEVLQKYHFTHLVEKSRVGDMPACLSLVETQQAWRLWRVN